MCVFDGSETITNCSLGSASVDFALASAEKEDGFVPFGASDELSSPSSCDLIHSFYSAQKTR